MIPPWLSLPVTELLDNYLYLLSGLTLQFLLNQFLLNQFLLNQFLLNQFLLYLTPVPLKVYEFGPSISLWFF